MIEGQCLLARLRAKTACTPSHELSVQLCLQTMFKFTLHTQDIYRLHSMKSTVDVAICLGQQIDIEAVGFCRGPKVYH